MLAIIVLPGTYALLPLALICLLVPVTCLGGRGFVPPAPGRWTALGFSNCVPLIPKGSLETSCGAGGSSSPLLPEQLSCPPFSIMASRAHNVLGKDILLLTN